MCFKKRFFPDFYYLFIFLYFFQGNLNFYHFKIFLPVKKNTFLIFSYIVKYLTDEFYISSGVKKI